MGEFFICNYFIEVIKDNEMDVFKTLCGASCDGLLRCSGIGRGAASIG
ncbi:hypothetical protein NTGHW29_190011 [Candidatus Nitrotoga sp. HW29]|nr:hypothetical protein NTGHW29_190011 [Candidatus Nitrotoga sp. HW29]